MAFFQLIFWLPMLALVSLSAALCGSLLLQESPMGLSRGCLYDYFGGSTCDFVWPHEKRATKTELGVELS